MRPERPQPQMFTTADGMRHAWYELARPDAPGPVILLQHGFSATTWHEWVEPGIADAIAELGRRVIGLDALGHGASSRSHDSADYGEGRMSADISALADHLGIEAFDYLGYSMGGIIGLRLAVAEPRLRRLIVAGIGEGVIACGGVDTRVLDRKLLAQGLRADDVSAYPEMVRGFRAGVEAMGNDRLALAAHADAILTDQIPLDRITAPNLLIAGDADPLAAHPRSLADAIPDCRLVMVPGDHVAARLDPAFVRAVLDFLA
jgi:pimeloyl-ACP methyl ester carboxylesterase